MRLGRICAHDELWSEAVKPEWIAFTIGRWANPQYKKRDESTVRPTPAEHEAAEQALISWLGKGLPDYLLEELWLYVKKAWGTELSDDVYNYFEGVVQNPPKGSRVTRQKVGCDNAGWKASHAQTKVELAYRAVSRLMLKDPNLADYLQPAVVPLSDASGTPLTVDEVEALLDRVCASRAKATREDLSAAIEEARRNECDSLELLKHIITTNEPQLEPRYTQVGVLRVCVRQWATEKVVDLRTGQNDASGSR